MLQRLAELQKRHTYTAGENLPWWHDNAGHLAAGFGLGALAHLGLALGYVGVGGAFLACALVWEAYEYRYGIRPWDPEDGWCHDHAVEDTLLDTYVGLTGALLAVLVL